MSAKEQRRLADQWIGRPTPDWITGQLVKLLRGGVSPQNLRRDAPKLAGELCPPSKYPSLTEGERRYRAVEMIREAIGEAGDDYELDVGEALRCLFALAYAGRRDSSIKARTEEAAEVLGLKPRYFQRRYQDDYIESVADKLHEKLA